MDWRIKATEAKGREVSKAKEKDSCMEHLTGTNGSYFFKTEIKCYVVRAGSYSPTFCYRMNIHLTWVLQKTLKPDGHTEEQQLLTLCGEISYNVSSTSAYLATVKGPD